MLKEAGINYAHRAHDRIVANNWRFPVAQIRFADLAVLNSIGDPLVLVEIKDADIKNEANSAQLDNYLSFIQQEKNKKVEFLFLSRAVPPEKEERKLQAGKRTSKRVHQMLFGQLYKPLKGSDPFCQMLRQYLEDINVVYLDKVPDAKALQYVTRRMLGIGGRQGTERSMPEFFSVVFGNLSSMGQWVQNKNPKLFKQGFKRRVYVEPWHDVQRLHQVMTSEAAADNKAARELRKAGYLGEYCKGGKVYFYTCGTLTHKMAKVYLEFGYWSDMEKRSKSVKYSSGIYALVQWAPWRGIDCFEDYEALRSFPNEQTFQKEMRTFLKFSKASLSRSKKCPANVKRAVQLFEIP